METNIMGYIGVNSFFLGCILPSSQGHDPTFNYTLLGVAFAAQNLGPQCY